MHHPVETPPAETAPMWLVVNTQPNREGTVVANLARQGYAPYCPLIAKSIRHARRTQQVTRPLFPGYVFVEYPKTSQSWAPITGTYGVRSLIGGRRSDHQPALLRPDFINALRARERSGVIVEPEVTLAIGQPVTIRGGAMDGVAAKVCELRERDRIVVLLDLLHQKVRLNIPSDMVEPA